MRSIHSLLKSLFLFCVVSPPPHPPNEKQQSQQSEILTGSKDDKSKQNVVHCTDCTTRYLRHSYRFDVMYALDMVATHHIIDIFTRDLVCYFASV